MMRSVFFLSAILAAIFTIPKPTEASANSVARLQCAARDYEAAAQLFHRSLSRCRRADDYTERMADRLACAARELSDAVHHGDWRHVFCVFDEVSILHDTLDRLLVRECRRPDPIIVGLWQHQEIVYRRLLVAMDAYRPECVMPPFRPRIPPIPTVPRVTISSPSGIPWFLKAQHGDWHGNSRVDEWANRHDPSHRGTSPWDVSHFDLDHHKYGNQINVLPADRSTLQSDRDAPREGIRYQPGRYGRMDNSPRR